MTWETTSAVGRGADSMSATGATTTQPDAANAMAWKIRPIGKIIPSEGLRTGTALRRGESRTVYWTSTLTGCSMRRGCASRVRTMRLNRPGTIDEGILNVMLVAVCSTISTL